MRHLCDFACFLAKQVLSQLSYTPTVSDTTNSKATAAVRKHRKKDDLSIWIGRR
jgi:hypothetical protein